MDDDDDDDEKEAESDDDGKKKKKQVLFINVRNSNGSTALHRAAASGETACVEALLAAGADIKAKDDEGKTALDLAKQAMRDGVIAVLEQWSSSSSASSSSSSSSSSLSPAAGAVTGTKRKRGNDE